MKKVEIKNPFVEFLDGVMKAYLVACANIDANMKCAVRKEYAIGDTGLMALIDITDDLRMTIDIVGDDGDTVDYVSLKYKDFGRTFEKCVFKLTTGDKLRYYLEGLGYDVDDALSDFHAFIHYMYCELKKGNSIY